MAQNERTISQVLQELASQYDAPIKERALFDRVLQLRPSQAKDPYASIREKLRWEGSQVGWVRLGDGNAIPLRVVRQGLRFRIIPDDDEYHHDHLLKRRMFPFISVYDTDLHLQNADGSPLRSHTQDGIGFTTPVALDGWFRRTQFQQGDSILVTIVHQQPLTLRLEREPATAFRTDDVLRAENELVEGVAKQVERSRSNLISAEETILPIYARSDWRTAYPGRPWQQLVQRDRRFRLIDDLFLASSNFRRPLDLLFEETDDQQRNDDDAALLEQINAFQAELLASRRTDADHGVWDGRAPRASTARMIFDSQAGTTTVVFLEPVDALQDHSAAIEDTLAKGGYDSSSWDGDFDDDFDDDDDDDFFDDDEIEDIQAFMAENPSLAEAAQKLMAALTPEELEQLQNAETPEEAQFILASRFQSMLRDDPSLFATLVPYVPGQDEDLPITTNGTNGYHNGTNGHHGMSPPEQDFLVELWDDNDAEEEIGIPWDEVSAEHVLGESAASRAALERSQELSEHFYQYQREHGKSDTTARNRANDLLVYADFLANYYHRNLLEGDYATLDECLFFYFPRRVMRSSPRLAREMCTSIKQFYAFLQEQHLANDAFAQAIWRRRDQAARVVELYEHIDSDSPQFERLFAFLFAPYTV